MERGPEGVIASTRPLAGRVDAQMPPDRGHLQNGAYGLSADDACTPTARETGPLVLGSTAGLEARALSLTSLVLDRLFPAAVPGEQPVPSVCDCARPGCNRASTRPAKRPGVRNNALRTTLHAPQLEAVELRKPQSSERLRGP